MRLDSVADGSLVPFMVSPTSGALTKRCGQLPPHGARHLLRRVTVALPLLAVVAGCASADATFAMEMNAFQQGHYQQAIEKFYDFAYGRCGGPWGNPRCKEARVTAAEAYLRLGDLREAFRAAEQARWDEPVSGPLTARIDGVQARAHEEASKSFRLDAGAGRLSVRFQNQEVGRIHFLKLTLAVDFLPLSGEVTRIDDQRVFRTIPPAAVPAGEHSLDVIAAYESVGPTGYPYRYTGHRYLVLPVANGEAVDVQIDVTEDRDWTSWQKALRMTVEVHRGSKVVHSEIDLL
ncbi:MAG TPA: hypothetical protein VMT03_24690 [Polyangia bacterium]|nr:hypothetical protein [Polyangia bacterium]